MSGIGIALDSRSCPDGLAFLLPVCSSTSSTELRNVRLSLKLLKTTPRSRECLIRQRPDTAFRFLRTV